MDPVSLASVTVCPPVAAGPDMVRVPVEDAPPIADTGLKTTLVGFGAVTVRTAFFVVELKLADKDATVSMATAVVVMVNVPTV